MSQREDAKARELIEFDEYLATCIKETSNTAEKLPWYPFLKLRKRKVKYHEMIMSKKEGACRSTNVCFE